MYFYRVAVPRHQRQRVKKSGEDKLDLDLAHASSKEVCFTRLGDPGRPWSPLIREALGGAW